MSQLWLGFFDFYAQKFDFKTNVVSIRQLEKMSKFEKLWNSDTLAVEDPFDLKRNLGGALTKRSMLTSLVLLCHSRYQPALCY